MKGQGGALLSTPPLVTAVYADACSGNRDMIPSRCLFTRFPTAVAQTGLRVRGSHSGESRTRRRKRSEAVRPKPC